MVDAWCPCLMVCVKVYRRRVALIFRFTHVRSGRDTSW